MEFRNYIAVVHREKDSGFGVSFPDFPTCITVAENLGEAKENAIEALSGHIELMLEEGMDIPEPTSLNVFMPEKEFNDSIVCIFEIRPVVEVKKEKAVRINISLEENILKMADEHCKETGASRSGLISTLLYNHIVEHRRQKSIKAIGKYFPEGQMMDEELRKEVEERKRRRLERLKRIKASIKSEAASTSPSAQMLQGIESAYGATIKKQH